MHKISRALLLATALVTASPMFIAPALAATPADQLVVGFSMTNILTMDPAAITGRDAVQVLANVYDNLVRLDTINRSVPKPGIAATWDVSEDKTAITFHLDPKAVFASGNPVTAQDVVWSLARVLKLNVAQASFLKTHGFNADNADASFTATDEHTVLIKLPKLTDPNIVILTLAIPGVGSIVDSKLALENEKDGDLASAWLTTNAAGSGPYNLQSWKSNELVLLNRNDKYWRAAPAMKRITMRHLPESQTERLMLERGDLDAGFALQAADLQALSQNKDVVVESNPGAGFYYLGVSMEDERFANPKVREALRYLIDYQGLDKAVMPFFGKLHQRPISTGFMGLLPDQGYTLDVEKAKALLAEAGYPDGFKTTLRALSEPPFLNIATAMQSTLAQAGIQAELITGSGDTIYGAMRERNFELIVGRGGGGQLPHPDSNMRALIYNPDNSDEAKLTNFQGWRTSFFDAELNTLIDKALVEPDQAAQIKDYEAIQNRFDELVPSLQPFSEVVDSGAYRADVKGLAVMPWVATFEGVTKQR